MGIRGNSGYGGGSGGGSGNKKTAASGVDSFLGVTGWLVASFASSLFISLLFSFGVPVFNVFLFQ